MRSPLPRRDPARVEGAAAEITQLTTALSASEGSVDEPESALDTLLGLVERPVVLVDGEPRIRGLNREAARLVLDRRAGCSTIGYW